MARLGGLALTSVALRGLGLLSQVVIAATFGAGASLDAFFIALIAPLLVWGPAITTFELIITPRYQRAFLRDPIEAARIRNGLVSWMVVVGPLISITMSLASPLLVQVVAPGAGDDVRDLAVRLSRVINVGVGFRLLAAALGGLLVARGRLFIVTAVRSVNSLALISVVLIGGTNPEALAWGTLAGDVMEAALVLGVVGSADGWFRLTWTTHLGLFNRSVLNFHLAQVAATLVPAIDTAFISGLSLGTIAIYTLSLRLFDATKSVFLLPNARITVAESSEWTGSSQRALRRTIGVGIAAASALALGGPLLFLTVYSNGEFTREDALKAVPILLALSTALVSTAFTYVLPRLLVIFGESSFVTRTSVLFVAGNLLLDAVLVGPFGATGVAAASTLTATVVGILQYRRVRAHLHDSTAIEGDQAS